MSWFTIELPLPPTANNMYPTNKRTGKRYPSARLLQWRKDAGWELQIAKPDKISGPYLFHLSIPAKARGDTDGYLKAPLDLLAQMELTPDDKHCVNPSAWRDPNVPKGRCIVLVGGV